MTEIKRQDIWDCKTSQAYLFGVPTGFFGTHHFYLGRYGFGFLYLFTFGLFGLGWLADLFRMNHLVKRSNKERKDVFDYESDALYVDDAYILALPPLGLFGAHHFYLNRPGWGFLYLFTVGLFGIGWLVDLFRIPLLVRDANLRKKQNVRVFTFPANNPPPTYVRNGQYPTAPYAAANGQYPNAPYVTATQNPMGYQSTEQPPPYTATEEVSHNEEHLKQFPPP